MTNQFGVQKTTIYYLNIKNNPTHTFFFFFLPSFVGLTDKKIEKKK